ncbi:hypothetical protein HJV72_14550 [Extibacter sp. GGCC_0201]|nr:hypothetical protein [Extibacter sp. GGCC_0201]
MNHAIHKLYIYKTFLKDVLSGLYYRRERKHEEKFKENYVMNAKPMPKSCLILLNEERQCTILTREKILLITRRKIQMNEYNLPQKWNLYNFTGLPLFDNWDEGAEANAVYNQKKERLNALQKKYRVASIICAVLSPFIFLSGVGRGYWFVGVALAIIASLIRKNGYITRKTVHEKLNEAASDWQQVVNKHADMFIKPVAEKLMSGGWYSYRTGLKCLIYGKEGCVYFDTSNSTLVAYNKANIKDVTRERLHLGSSTSGGAQTTGGGYTFKNGITIGGGNTKTYSNTVNAYEWHFDIFTDFLDYPKVSLVLDDNKSVEEFVGKAYALLKP